MAGTDDELRRAEIRRQIDAWMADQMSRPPPTRGDYRRMWWLAAARNIGLGAVGIAKALLGLFLVFAVLATCAEMQNDVATDMWEIEH